MNYPSEDSAAVMMGLARDSLTVRRAVRFFTSQLCRGVLLSCAVPLAGCATYIHSPGRATVTADLQTRFGALSTPAYFDAQEKNLDDFARGEDKALAELLVASRDYRLLNIIKPASTVSEPGRKPEMRLASLVSSDLRASYGRSVLTPAEAQTLITSRFVKDLAVRTTAFNERRVASTVRSYKAAGGTLATGCKAVLASVADDVPPLDHATPAQATRYGQLAGACKDLAKRTALAEDCTLAVVSGNLAAVCQGIAALADDKAVRNAQLADAEKALKEASKSKTPEDPNKGLQGAIDFLSGLDGLPTDERLSKVLAQIDALFGSELENSLTRLDKKGRAILPKATEPLLRALELLGAIRDLEVANAAQPLDQPSALLIGIAKIRHDRNLIAIDLDEAEQRQELLFTEASLLRAQLYYLAQAQQALCGRVLACASVAVGKPVTAQLLDEALSSYVRSQNVGNIPFEILRFREIQVQRAAALNRARASEVDYRAQIKPAIDQIAAYGAGGIKPETIANFVAGLPLAGAILVK